jgi:CAAX protease family protein
VISFRRIKSDWYASIILLFPVAAVLAIAIDTRLLGGEFPPVPGIIVLINQPINLLQLLVIGLVAGPLSEELGWRGFALERMQVKWNPKLSSLVLWLVTAVWHLPLFLIIGTAQYYFGLGTPYFVLFMLNILPNTIFLTWAYNYNRRSILAAILIHFFFNLTTSLFFPLSERTEAIRFVVTALAVMAVVWVNRSEKILEEAPPSPGGA